MLSLLKDGSTNAKKKNENFKLKSFHLEQLITENYKQNINLEIFDSVFKCLSELKEKIEMPILRDRGDNSKFIDSYVSELTTEERNLIHEAVDAILISFENIDAINNINQIVTSGFYKRASASEKFLFDQKIAVLIDDAVQLKIDGFVKDLDGFRQYKANLKIAGGVVDTKNKIDFKVVTNTTNYDVLKWKVKNDNNCKEARGEITDHHTYVQPESTAFIGKHFVECYSIKNNVCIAKDLVNVVVKQ